MSRDVLNLVTGLAGMCGCLFGYRYVVKRVWRGDTETTNRIDAAFSAVTTQALGKGVTRAFPVLGLAAFLLATTVTIISALRLFNPRGMLEKVLIGTAMATGLTFLMLAVFGQLFILLFNRPRFLVPPHRRQEPGWLIHMLRLDRPPGRVPGSKRDEHGG